jgi:hypothetical protein
MPQIPRDSVEEAETDEQIFLECADRMKMAEEIESINRANAIDDLEFADGQQWPDDIQNMRQSSRQISLTINHTATLVRRVVNNMRQQRPRIKVHPTGGGARVEDARVAGGLIRHVETLSKASVAYDTGGESAVRIGWGYCRVVGEYVDDKSFEQELYIKAVRNTFTGYIDPGAVMPDGSDMDWFIFSAKMKKTEFKRHYPGVQLNEWIHMASGDNQSQWENKEEIRLAEYYRIKKTKDTLYQIEGGNTLYKSEYDANREAYDLAGLKLAQKNGKPLSRPTTRRQVQWFMINGTKVVETRDLPGTYIPVVRFEGNVLDLNGQVRRKGMIRDIKDPARMVNYWEAMALDTPLPTPGGWTTMGAVKRGDELFDESGAVCRVVGKSPIYIKRPCYRLTFDNGTSVVTDACHKWRVEEKAKLVTAGILWESKTLTTKELVVGKHCVLVAKPLQTADSELPIDPYFLGVWLGDGTSTTAQIHAGHADAAEMRKNLEAIGLDVGEARGGGRNCAVFTIHGQRARLASMGLLKNKHIPTAYLRASAPQRMALLQGLMDTDGSISALGQCEFTNTNPRIAEGFAEIMNSLGIKCVMRVRKRMKMYVGETEAHAVADAHQFNFTTYQPIFRLTRKLDRLGLRKAEPKRTNRHRIVKIEPVDSVPVQCLEVDSASHLFLAGFGMVPTHNSAKTAKLALSAKAPWVMAEGQSDGHPEWDDANQKPYSSLKYKLILGLDGNPLPGLPPPQRQAAVEVEAGFAEAMQSAMQHMTAVAGMPHEPTQDSPGAVVSGVALRRRQAISDISHFQYYDNQTQAIAQVGRILLDLFPYYYGESRMQRIIGEDGVPQMVGINQQQTNDQGIVEIKNNLTVGKFDVVMDTGPGYETKRQEGADSMLDLLKTPLAEPISKTGADLIVRNMDFAGAEDLADRLMPMNAQGMQKAVEALPKEAQGMVQALMTQNQQKDQTIQHLQLELKYKTGIETSWQQTELKKTEMQTHVKAHDVDKRDSAAERDTQVKAHTTLLVAEIGAAGQLLNTNTEAAHDRAAAKEMVDSAASAEHSNGAA